MIRLILFCVVGLMATGGTSMAENVSLCTADTLPIQIVGSWNDGPVTTLSEALRFKDYPPYNTFVTTVTKHLATKLAQTALCPNKPESSHFSLIKFGYLSYYVREDDNVRSIISTLQVRPSGVCRISSPWIDLAIGRDVTPRVRGIIRFNERQLLADQAVMAGVCNVPPGVAVPVTHIELLAYANEYDRYVSDERDARYGKPENHSPNPIEERVPPDYLWLFRKLRSYGSSGIRPFAGYVSEAMPRVMEKGTEGYTKIVIALIDQCFESGGAEIHYNSILDIDDPALLEQYKIVTPLR